MLRAYHVMKTYTQSSISFCADAASHAFSNLPPTFQHDMSYIIQYAPSRNCRCGYIAKGRLRIRQVEHTNVFLQWICWGCTPTSTLIEMQKQIENGINPVGIDKLSSTDKKRVYVAIANGSIPDEDVFVPTPEQETETNEREDEAEDEGKVEPVIGSPYRLRGRSRVEYEDEDEGKVEPVIGSPTYRLRGRSRVEYQDEDEGKVEPVIGSPTYRLRGRPRVECEDKDEGKVEPVIGSPTYRLRGRSRVEYADEDESKVEPVIGSPTYRLRGRSRTEYEGFGRLRGAEGDDDVENEEREGTELSTDASLFEPMDAPFSGASTDAPPMKKPRLFPRVGTQVRPKPRSAAPMSMGSFREQKTEGVSASPTAPMRRRGSQVPSSSNRSNTLEEAVSQFTSNNNTPVTDTPNSNPTRVEVYPSATKNYAFNGRTHNGEPTTPGPHPRPQTQPRIGKIPPKLPLLDFCLRYGLSPDLREKLEEMKIPGPHVLRLISDQSFEGKLQVGEVAELRDAEERWMEGVLTSCHGGYELDD
ncbi:hypothetical protein E1B28_004953 [Marasmius oreades]|uniref:Uncharacterized protein n=1 Tax=Marasmius oreades TaxID=181124 RepID=A0A9P8ADS6_9AGAR|nr:uncharacterized protein E1B28_004953 [Marasmius oreades]KAG7097620.1 hypothetical protein E1B28_004953 [Marasmius oreades]